MIETDPRVMIKGWGDAAEFGFVLPKKKGSFRSRSPLKGSRNTEEGRIFPSRERSLVHW